MLLRQILMIGILLIGFASGWAAASVHLPFEPVAAGCTVPMRVDSPRVAGFWERSDHPLDIAYRECIVAEGPGDYAIRYCLQVSLDDWEKELGRSYDALLHMLPPNSASAKQLKHTQKLWEKFRKAEFAWIEMQNSKIEGTMYEQIMLEEKLAIVRERALQLFWYQRRLEADS